MSAPLMPAARTRTSSSPAWGRGSGCSCTEISPSWIVAARIAAMVAARARALRTPRTAVSDVLLFGYMSAMEVPSLRLTPLWRESLVGFEAAALLRSPVWRGEGVPPGDGRPVLLVPGFLAGDGTLATMAKWLRANGYWTRPAGIGTNVGCSQDACERLEGRPPELPAP